MTGTCAGCRAEGFRLTGGMCDGCYETARQRTLACLLSGAKPRPVKRLWRRCRWSNG